MAKLASIDYYRSVKDRRENLRSRIREIAQTRVRYGYRRIQWSEVPAAVRR